MTATIPLAKGFDLSKMTFPAYLSIKHDGVPVKLTIHTLGSSEASWRVETRPGKPCPSVHAYCVQIVQRLLDNNMSGTFVFLAEITHKTLTNFKDISGVVRKKTQQPDLIWNVFDYHQGNRQEPFSSRRQKMWQTVKTLDLPFLKYVHQTPVFSIGDADMMIKGKQADYPDAEGLILVAGDRPFKPGARHWDYQKIVVDPVSDLRVIGFEEAVSKSGEPLGMVGRIIVEYNGKEEGCGPGKLSHDERKELWELFEARREGMCAEFEGGWPKRANLIAAVKHKRDPSYSGLRQPTFQHWREDKDEPNEE